MQTSHYTAENEIRPRSIVYRVFVKSHDGARSWWVDTDNCFERATRAAQAYALETGRRCFVVGGAA